MTSRERLLLIVGLTIGVGLGALSWWVFKPMTPSSSALHTPAIPASAAHDGMAVPNAPAPAMEHEVELGEREQQAIGLKTFTVAVQPLAEGLRTVGRVEQAETQLATISARVAGRLDKLFVAFTGQPVRKGQPVASIYSPQVVASAEEFKLAMQARANLGANAHPTAITQAEDLIHASRRRLELWGLTHDQIDEITKSETPKVQVTVYSTVQGVITERKVAEGQYVQEGETLYTVSDLSNVWVMADVYEADLGRVHVGERAEIEAQAFPGGVNRGMVSFIDPSVNPQTRTAAVRIQMANPGMKLRPGMFVNVTLGSGRSDRLVIPRTAVLETGEKRVVYVAKGNGAFERREIETGASAGDFLPVLRGLKAGEEVVSQGAFLIDSQSRVSGAMSGMYGGAKAYEKGTANNDNQYRVSLSLDPDPPEGGKAVQVKVSLQDAGGKPVPDAAVTVTFVMPAMPSMGMPELRNSHALNWDGDQYSGEAKVQSSGSWNVIVEVSRGGKRIATKRSQVTAR